MTLCETPSLPKQPPAAYARRMDIGAPELLIVFAVIILLFGASKLPELARGSGRALRIFKAETSGLLDDDDKAATTPVTRDPLDPKTP
jgi:sec-independent protein translocase protein TatA